jgi:hypothetical protein
MALLERFQNVPACALNGTWQMMDRRANSSRACPMRASVARAVVEAERDGRN